MIYYKKVYKNVYWISPSMQQHKEKAIRNFKLQNTTILRLLIAKNISKIQLQSQVNYLFITCCQYLQLMDNYVKSNYYRIAKVFLYTIDKEKYQIRINLNKNIYQIYEKFEDVLLNIKMWSKQPYVSENNRFNLFEQNFIQRKKAPKAILPKIQNTMKIKMDQQKQQKIYIKPILSPNLNQKKSNKNLKIIDINRKELTHSRSAINIQIPISLKSSQDLRTSFLNKCKMKRSLKLKQIQKDVEQKQMSVKKSNTSLSINDQILEVSKETNKNIKQRIKKKSKKLQKKDNFDQLQKKDNFDQLQNLSLNKSQLFINQQTNNIIQDSVYPDKTLSIQFLQQQYTNNNNKEGKELFKLLNYTIDSWQLQEIEYLKQFDHEKNEHGIIQKEQQIMKNLQSEQQNVQNFLQNNMNLSSQQTINMKQNDLTENQKLQIKKIQQKKTIIIQRNNSFHNTQRYKSDKKLTQINVKQKNYSKFQNFQQQKQSIEINIENQTKLYQFQKSDKNLNNTIIKKHKQNQKQIYEIPKQNLIKIMIIPYNPQENFEQFKQDIKQSLSYINKKTLIQTLTFDNCTNLLMISEVTKQIVKNNWELLSNWIKSIKQHEWQKIRYFWLGYILNFTFYYGQNNNQEEIYTKFQKVYNPIGQICLTKRSANYIDYIKVKPQKYFKWFLMFTEIENDQVILAPFTQMEIVNEKCLREIKISNKLIEEIYIRIFHKNHFKLTGIKQQIQIQKKYIDKFNQWKNKSLVCDNITYMCIQDNNYQQALIYCKKSYQIKKFHKNQQNILNLSFTTYKLATIYKKLEDYQNALKYFKQNMQYQILILKYDPKSWAIGAMSLAEIYVKLKKYQEGKLMYKNILMLQNQVLSQQIIADCMQDLGKIYLIQNKKKQALDNFLSSLKIHNTIYKKNNTKINRINEIIFKLQSLKK